MNEIYDLVLLDIILPYKSGDEILKEMRSFSDIPVIIKDMIGTKIDHYTGLFLLAISNLKKYLTYIRKKHNIN
jgi:DNA-binding response OmpR family regulator